MKLELKALLHELKVFYYAWRDQATPLAVKLFMVLALGYIILPFDFVPDALPIIGQLDEVIIVPLLLTLAHRLIPKEVLNAIEQKIAAKEPPQDSKLTK